MDQPSPNPYQKLLGYLLATMATVIWSGNYIIARGIHQEFPPVQLAFSRWIVAWLCLLPFGLPELWRKRHLVIGNLPYFTLTALLGISLFNTLIYIAGHTTSALNLALIASFSPVFIVLYMRIFTGLRITATRAAGLVLAILGAAVLLTGGHLAVLARLEFTRGDIWMLLGASAFGAYSFLVRSKPRELSGIAFLTILLSLGLVFLLPWLIYELNVAPPARFSVTNVLIVAYVGIGASIIALLAWNKSISLIGAAKTGFVYYSLPLFSGIEAVILLGEPVTWAHPVSGVLILGGIALATRR